MIIKIVKYGDRINPIYKEIGEIETKLISLDYDDEDGVECIDLNDLLEFLNLR